MNWLRYLVVGCVDLALLRVLGRGGGEVGI